MIQWEYLFIKCDYHKEDWHPRYVNGKEVAEGKHWSEMTIYEFSNLLGERGWELFDLTTGHDQRGNTQDYRLVFKRPKAK